MSMSTRSEIIYMMQRTGMEDRVAEAQQVLPEVVDLDRDEGLLYGLGVSVDRMVDRLGGSAW